MAKAAVKYINAGFKSLKLKTGGDIKGGIERFATVRAAVGSDVEIGVDMDGMFNAPDALCLIRERDHYRQHFAEQPVTKPDLRGFVEVRRKSPAPIVADESAWSIDELVALITAAACDICHLALDRIGGFRKALQFRAMLAANHMDYAICTYNAPEINHAVISHFACACSKRGPICDELGTIFMFLGGTDTDHVERRSMVKEINSRVIGGVAYAPKGPGLGIELDDEVVASYLTDGVSPITVTA
jgi:L-alanine-DL-glutamate epimerase-like enolase superfamily enzyme